MKFRFNKKYALMAVLLTVALIILMLFSNNLRMNASFGNIGFTVLIYCLIQAFIKMDKKLTLIITGLFCLIFEISKSFDWIEKLNWSENPVFSNLLGNNFNIDNIWSYIIGCGMIYMLEFYQDTGRPRKKKLFGF